MASFDGAKYFIECLHERMKNSWIKTITIDGNCILQVDGIETFYIPIFSESFASDVISLSVLVDIVKQRRNLANTHILPVFFAVEPADVSLRTPLFKDTLTHLQKKFNLKEKVVNRWKDALVEVANIRGWSVPQSYTSEDINEPINSVCRMVLCKLKSSKGACLVGIDHHVARILNLLDLEVNDVRVVGVWGRDGAGKTTLARAAYHQLYSGFEACCFLDEIDVRARHPDGVRYLQAKMVSDLLNREMEVKENITEGINLIRERLCSMKVLIVLDDISEVSHLKALAVMGNLCWFGPGSRIIITAQEKNFIEVIPSAQGYEVSFDSPRENEKPLQLFSMHALFRRTNPNEEFDSMSRQIMKTLDPCRGLLLSAEILGSFLCGKSVADWRGVLKGLEADQHTSALKHADIEEIIRMSYGSLNERQKQIFLDISCFPQGIDSRIALSFWHGSLRSPCFDDFEVLIQLSLVKIDDSNRIWMHHIVRDFGRYIIFQPQGNKQGTKEVQVSCSPSLSELTLTPNIKFLKLYHENTHSDFDTVFARLRGFTCQRWSQKWQTPELHFKDIVFLDLSWCKNWAGCHKIQAPKLTVLDLTGCTGLLKTPDLSLCLGLEMLILECCTRLLKIDPSIQHLQHLATLNLKHCTELSVLPKEVGCLKALKELHVDGTSIEEIPISIGHLINLKILSATNCSSLGRLPHSTCGLLSITVLKLDFAIITELPCTIWKEMKLHHLSLRDCRCIRSLPPFVGDVESSLKELDASGTSISELPLSIVKLKNLRVLKVDFSFIREFPPNFGELKNLEELHASWCRNLEDIPDDIGKLKSLRVFKLGHSSIFSIPKSILLLRRLEMLDCTSCNKLQSLPELPSSLTSLHVHSTELMPLHDLKNCKELIELTSGNDDIMRSYPSKASNLRTLDLNLPQLRDLPTLPNSLRKLSFCCSKLKLMPKLPLELVVLSLQDCRSLTKLPTMEPLQNLLQLEILHCSKIKKIEGLGGLKALRILKISDCRIKSLHELDKLTSLIRFTLHDCRMLGYLCVKSLRSLIKLDIRRCPELKKIEGLEEIRGELYSLNISYCGVKTNIFDENLRS